MIRFFEENPNFCRFRASKAEGTEGENLAFFTFIIHSTWRRNDQRGLFGGGCRAGVHPWRRDCGDLYSDQ
jgi:hypothetical protein